MGREKTGEKLRKSGEKLSKLSRDKQTIDKVVGEATARWHCDKVVKRQRCRKLQKVHTFTTK